MADTAWPNQSRRKFRSLRGARAFDENTTQIVPWAVIRPPREYVTVLQGAISGAPTSVVMPMG
jgi:hypothetical protein